MGDDFSNKYPDLSLHNWRDKTILIVEDDPISLMLLQEFLADTHVAIHYASNGEDALQLFQKNPHINLVLLDLQLPEMDGFETFFNLKKINNDVTVIAQTAFASNDMRNRCLDAGFSDFLSKPILLNACIEALSKYLDD